MNIEELREHLCASYPELCPLFSIEFGDGVLSVPSQGVHAAAADLKALGFDFLGMVTAVDHGGEFELLYRVRSGAMHVGLILKTRVPRSSASIGSVVDLWPAADWHEREVYDLFGIYFEGHPDLRRILLPEDWVGHPLRKDYEDEHVIPRPDHI